MKSQTVVLGATIAILTTSLIGAVILANSDSVRAAKYYNKEEIKQDSASLNGESTNGLSSNKGTYDIGADAVDNSVGKNKDGLLQLGPNVIGEDIQTDDEIEISGR
jgi:hypothetical protein